jgi:hypothetical protein
VKHSTVSYSFSYMQELLELKFCLVFNDNTVELTRVSLWSEWFRYVTHIPINNVFHGKACILTWGLPKRMLGFQAHIA